MKNIFKTFVIITLFTCTSVFAMKDNITISKQYQKLQMQDVDSVIAIGSVIRGETMHFDFICNATSSGIKDLNVSGKCPVIFCVLTDDNIQQSIDRSGGKYGNKGSEAAIAAIEMALI